MLVERNEFHKKSLQGKAITIFKWQKNLGIGNAVNSIVAKTVVYAKFSF